MKHNFCGPEEVVSPTFPLCARRCRRASRAAAGSGSLRVRSAVELRQIVLCESGFTDCCAEHLESRDLL